jgi:hypothetical protein
MNEFLKFGGCPACGSASCVALSCKHISTQDSATGEAVVIEWPEYHSSEMGCSLGDSGIHDRYTAMQHGWNRAVKSCREAVGDAPLYTSPSQPTVLVSNATQSLADEYEAWLHCYHAGDDDFTGFLSKRLSHTEPTPKEPT